jgi:hypothetical protein
MAAIAQRDQENRTIEVKRMELLETLIANRESHIADYEEAKNGYTAALLDKVNKAFEEAKLALSKKHEAATARVSGLTEADIENQRDSFTLIDAVYVEMKVPRCFEDEYDAAIDMVRWDVRETLVLTYAEFTCFVRDQWDWKSGFEAVSMIYKAMK